jgi:uncharacterized RDD family membrane protein YckC
MAREHERKPDPIDAARAGSYAVQDITVRANMDQDENPYRPPNSEVLLASEVRVVGPAGRWRRFGTLLVDYGCFVVLGVIFALVVGVVFGASGIAVMKRIPDFLLGSVLISCYYVAFEGAWSRTPGKWVFGTVVVDEGGARPSLKQVLGRTACRFIPFEAFSFLSNQPGWHDRIPGTRVVRCR